jgi:hypothetical protein
LGRKAFFESNGNSDKKTASRVCRVGGTWVIELEVFRDDRSNGLKIKLVFLTSFSEAHP